MPKCLGGSDDVKNIVKLTPKAHYVAHHLLHKAFPDNKKLSYAFGMMIKGKEKRKLNSRMYDECRKAISKAAKGRKRPDLGIINQQRRTKPIIVKNKLIEIPLMHII